MAEEYIAADGRLLYAGGGRLWLVDPTRGGVLEVAEEAGPVLQVADRFRTLAEHRRALLEAGWQDDGGGTLGALLAGLVRDGLLRSRSDLLRRILEAPTEEPPPPVSAIAWITRDRPRLLRRSVESAIANLRLYGRRADLRIYDDSADAGARQATRDMLAELGRREGFAVFYAGAEEKRAFASALRERAKEVSADTLEFALFDLFGIGCAPGANTNAVLLDTCGKRILHADDDTVFRFASPPEEAEAGIGLRLSAALDPTEIRFFPNALEREAAVSPGDMDFLAAHEALLGRSTADCLRQHGGQANCRELSPDSLPLLAGQGRVAATMAGAFGDSGMGSPLFVLWLSGRSREAAMASEESYRSAKRSREVLRAAPAVTLSQSPFLLTMHCGLDNRLALPPFLPVLRNADGIFGQLLRAVYPQGAIAHLPAAVLHLPGEPRAFQEQEREKPRLGSLLLLLVRSLAPAPWQTAPEQRLSAIGRGLVQAGNLPPAEFAALVRGLWAEEMSRYILALERLLQENNGEPGYWRKDAKAWVEQVRRQVTAEQALLPADLPSPQAAAAAQRVVQAYGQLILAWPALSSAAAALARAGRSFAPAL